MTEQESRKIGCCTAYTWTKWITYIDLTACIAVFLMSFLVTRIEVEEDDEFFQKEDRVRNAYIRMVAAFVGLGLPILLHLGIKQRNPSYIRIWILIKKILSGIVCLIIVVVFLFSADFGIIFASIFSIPVAINIFSIWVVSVYRDELIAQQTGGDSEVGFQQL